MFDCLNLPIYIHLSPVYNTSQTNGNEMNGVGNLIFHETEVAEVHFIFMGEVRVRILASYWSMVIVGVVSIKL